MLNENTKTYVIAPYMEGSCFPFEVTDKLLALIDKQPLTEEESEALDDCIKTIIDITSASKVYVKKEDDVLYITLIDGPLFMTPRYHREVDKKATTKEITDLILKNLKGRSQG